jgi:hypothetical protein
MLHRYIQAAMGWNECHLFSFTIEGREYGIPDRERETKVYDARRYTLARVSPNVPASFEYLYDFGAHWKHFVEIEREEEAVYRKQYPICVAGNESCPPEDCGGPAAYDEIRHVLKTLGHPRHAELQEWAESQIYPRKFLPEIATWTMRDVQRGYV